MTNKPKTKTKKTGGAKEAPKAEQLKLFELPEPDRLYHEFSEIERRRWTAHKAQMIEQYLYSFVMVTRHGTYIDGFSGPQYREHPDRWAAKLVLESQPRWLRNFFFAELDSESVRMLEELKAAQPPRNKEKHEAERRIDILPGDFNIRVDDILASGIITEKEATFCLLDQRTFECDWATVTKLARHKKVGKKIELFYFLSIKWLARALAARKDGRIEAWWGRDDWQKLKGLGNFAICQAFMDRFHNELGYKSVTPWPIYRSKDSNTVMYYMIHATDHPIAPHLMARAYRKTVYEKEPLEVLQREFDAWASDQDIKVEKE